jgi:hypothetical protein
MPHHHSVKAIDLRTALIILPCMEIHAQQNPHLFRNFDAVGPVIAH